MHAQAAAHLRHADELTHEVRFLPFQLGKLVDDDENARIIDLYGGFLIIPKFTRQVVSDFKELFFKTVDFPDYSVEVRVFTENGVKLSVGRGKDKVIENVPFSPSTLNLEKAFIDGKGYLVAFLSDKKTAVFGFEITNGILNGNGIRNVLKVSILPSSCSI